MAFVINNANWWIGPAARSPSLTMSYSSSPSSARLTLDTGAVLDNYDGIGVDFTSFYDDTRLGDTNGDGYTEGVDGDWEGIAEDESPGDLYLAKHPGSTRP